MCSDKVVVRGFKYFLAASVICCFPIEAAAQVYSPVITKQGQVDATNLKTLARDIYVQANARTPREKAEAIWRFFFTDGRFVKPGFWYHIAGWAYEEPRGEVLDPMKLIHSYGFGLCYHVAPLLEAVWDAGGFEHARVWFLTGHTVAEVFYDGAYHYFDSDMMGYQLRRQRRSKASSSCFGPPDRAGRKHHHRKAPRSQRSGPERG